MKPREIQATFDIDTLKRIDRSKSNRNKLFKSILKKQPVEVVLEKYEEKNERHRIQS